MKSLKEHEEPSRPRLDPELKERINKLADRLQINNMPLSNINNILCSIGLNCLEKSMDSFSEQIKSNDFVQKFLKELQ